MRLRRTLNFHSVKRGKVRQTWNKYNLYNLSKVQRTIPNFIRRTFFQQKWTAKALTRAYHGEHIKESKWERMFSRRLLSAVEMDPVYMAYNDGSEQAAGRGSGLDQPTDVDEMPWQRQGKTTSKSVNGTSLQRIHIPETQSAEKLDDKPGQKNRQEFSGNTPYMNMAYAPLERRIDVAIFRALFASSTRQARQFVIHGAVKINGQVMRHPSYLLNPGDMFQVDKEAVLFATGKKKSTVVAKQPKQRKAKNVVVKAEETKVEAEEADNADSATEGALENYPKEEDDAEQKAKDTIRKLRDLSRVAKKILDQEGSDINARKKRLLRVFVKNAREAMAKMGRPNSENVATTDMLASINEQFKELLLKIPNVAAKAEESGSSTPAEIVEAKDAAAAGQNQETPQQEEETVIEYHLSEDQLAEMKERIHDFHEHPYAPEKRYQTPWQPRRFMSAFAFIPRYLEVNQNICAAVYLRHPVARQGYAEVPSPFPPNVMQLAFNWYLRRR